MSSSPLGPPPLPGCFGKLPVAADFVTAGANGGPVHRFQEWLQEGVGLGHSRLGEGWEERFDRLPRTRFLFRPEASGGALAGSFGPSRDRSGRRFPFAAFAYFPYGPPAAAALPSGFARFFGEAERVAERGDVLTPGGPGGLAEAVDALRAALAPAEPAGPEASPGAAAAAAAFPADGTGALARAGGNLLAVAVRPGGVHAAPGFGLRFPLPAPGPEHAGVVSFWFSMVDRLLPGASASAAFWTQDGYAGNGRLDLYHPRPGGLAFVHLLDPGLESDGLYPLDEGEPPGARADVQAWMERARSVLADPAAPLDALVAALPGGGFRGGA